MWLYPRIDRIKVSQLSKNTSEQFLHRSLMSLTELAEYMFTEDTAEGRMKTISWLQGRQLLATRMTCGNCGVAGMNMVRRDRTGTQDDKWAWRC